MDRDTTETEAIRAPTAQATTTPADADRARLVALCADLHDRVGSEGLRQTVRRGLDEVGVRILVADGEPFDPARHEAVGAVPTDDAALIDTVASTQRCGIEDRGRVVRETQVLLYVAEDDGGL